MGAADTWDIVIDRGAMWRRSLFYNDANGAPIEIVAPGVMEIRTRRDDRTSALITRLDSTTEAPGWMNFEPESNEVVLYLPHTVTRTLTPGEYYHDIFVSLVTGDLVRVAAGKVTVRGNVSVL